MAYVVAILLTSLAAGQVEIKETNFPSSETVVSGGTSERRTQPRSQLTQTSQGFTVTAGQIWRKQHQTEQAKESLPHSKCRRKGNCLVAYKSFIYEGDYLHGLPS